MNKAKLFSIRFLLILIGVLITYFALVNISLIPISLLHALVICISIFMVFSLGLLIIAPGLLQGPEKFVMRFLVLTTFQLIAAMSILLAFVVSKQADLRILCFHFIGLFVLLLAIQSFLLVQINSKSTN